MQPARKNGAKAAEVREQCSFCRIDTAKRENAASIHGRDYSIDARTREAVHLLYSKC